MWLKFSKQIRSSDCIDRYNRLFVCHIFYRLIVSVHFKFRFSNRPISIFGLKFKIFIRQLSVSIKFRSCSVLYRPIKSTNLRSDFLSTDLTLPPSFLHLPLHNKYIWREQESIPRIRFRQARNRFLGSLKGLKIQCGLRCDGLMLRKKKDIDLTWYSSLYSCSIVCKLDSEIRDGGTLCRVHQNRG